MEDIGDNTMVHVRATLRQGHLTINRRLMDENQWLGKVEILRDWSWGMPTVHEDLYTSKDLLSTHYWRNSMESKRIVLTKNDVIRNSMECKRTMMTKNDVIWNMIERTRKIMTKHETNAKQSLKLLPNK